MRSLVKHLLVCFYMVAASGGKGSSPPSVPLASHLTAENFNKVPLGHDLW